MKIDRCKECGANLAMVGIRHRCIPINTPEARNSVRASTTSKRGRPRIGEQAVKPWVALGLTERTYYRRQKESKK